MTTPRFDPEPDADYGKCVTCGIPLRNEKEASDHRESTYREAKAIGQAKGHGTQVLNPSRADRIEREVHSIIEDAVHGGLSSIEDMIGRDLITEAEAAAAVKSVYVDFPDARKEYSA